MSHHNSPQARRAVSVISGLPKQPTEADRVIGLRIAALRKAKGLSQAQLGDAVGVTFQQIQKYEKGSNRVGAGRLAVIAGLLEVTVATLYGEESAAAEGRAEIFADLIQPGAFDLLRAYTAITDDAMRRHILGLVRCAARLDRGGEGLSHDPSCSSAPAMDI